MSASDGTDGHYHPPHAAPLDLGPVAAPSPQPEPRTIDTFLDDLFKPRDPLKPLIEAEPARSGAANPFPPAMWGWASATAVLAVVAALLILL